MLLPSRLWLFGVLVVLAGCADARPQPVEKESSVTEIGQAFDARATGTIRGQIHWEGPIPSVPPFEFRPKPQSPVAERLYYPNPNAPRVDSVSRGIGNAVVFLRSVDQSRSKPWDHAAIFAELSEKRLRLEQGHEPVSAGFARRGEPLTIKSGDDSLYVLRRRIGFLSLTFAEPHKPRQRWLERKGLVELSSAAGHFWQRAYVFVDEHPYYTRTDPQGRFAFEKVPAGDYQLVCWVPSWVVKEQERDTETSSVRFVTFGRPVEIEQPVNVLKGTEPTLQFRIEEKMFRP